MVAGTSTGLLWQAALSGQTLGPASVVKGGLGAVARAIGSAALEAGVEIRTDAEVAEIQIREARRPASCLLVVKSSLRELWWSKRGSAHNFLKLVDPVNFDPNFLGKIRNYRSSGSVAKVNLALSALPQFSALKGPSDSEKLTGRIHIGPDIDYLERAFDAAKYGDYSPKPYLDMTIPSLLDSSLAPSGAHVMSINVQFAPAKLKEGDWHTRREELGDTIVNLLSEYAPNLKDLIVRRQVITPSISSRNTASAAATFFTASRHLISFSCFAH